MSAGQNSPTSPGSPLAALFLSSHPSGYITGRIAARGADPTLQQEFGKTHVRH